MKGSSQTGEGYVTDELHDGLYQLLLTRQLERRVEASNGFVDRANIDEVELVERLTRHLSNSVRIRLNAARSAAERLQIANTLLALLDDPAEIVPPAAELLSVRQNEGPRYRERPRTPLNDAALLTNAPDEPSLAGELRAEIGSADRIDLLCAFVMWRGLRLLHEPLIQARMEGVPIRVITTTYIGGTERQALDRLVRDYGAEVKVQYDAARTRLHAKAWLFHRRSGFHTAYVGSSNLSTSALLDGVEWNVRLSESSTPTLLQKFRATFDAYWYNSEFEHYDPARDRDRLDDALNAAAGRRSANTVTISISGLQVRPFPHQQEMLDALAAERNAHDRHRNLVVAATGTGKTVVAALDYRALCESAPALPSLLFVAHRREILEQSLRTYREVLGDPQFGELYVGGARPERWQHVFASVQSLTAYGVTDIPSDAFDVVVVDEFHHAGARTYRTLMQHLAPRELLGLTATPERTDGVNVQEAFFEGRVAAELRLWDALGADLLCPFHYFAIADGTDLRNIGWSKGRYDSDQLAGVYTGNDRRSEIVLRELRNKVSNLADMKALGFCASVAHAEYMARVFNSAGVSASAIRLFTVEGVADDAAGVGASVPG